MSLGPSNQHRMVYISYREHDNPHELPKDNLEGSLDTMHTLYTMTESQYDVHDRSHNNTGIHFYSKHKYRDTFGDAHIQ